jgi:formamidopyrimidine-DNA glycosylase
MAERLQEWKGWRIEDVMVDTGLSPAASKRYLPGDEYNSVLGQAIQDVCRRGKYLVFVTSSGALLCHNAMSGYWDSALEPWTFDYVEGKRVSSSKDIRVGLTLECGTIQRTLYFHDTRKFGSLHFVDPTTLAQKLSKLGPDAMQTPRMYEHRWMHPEDMVRVFRSPKTVKEILMDQTKIAGVGNIYASEACWYAGISPFRVANTLPEIGSTSVLRVFLSVRSALYIALKRKLDYKGLMVYRQKECRVCKGPIRSQELKGRNTFWCPKCQE